MENFDRSLTFDLPDGRRSTFWFDPSDGTGGGAAGLITTATYRSAEAGNQIVSEIKVLGRDGEETLAGGVPAGRIIWGQLTPGQGWQPSWVQSLQYTGGVTFEDFKIPGWLIRLRDGTEYRVMRQVTFDNSESGIPDELGPPALDEIREPNGHRLKFVRQWDIASGRARLEGLVPLDVPAAPVVQFEHDDEGRIRRIAVEGLEKTYELRYSYDGVGNLIAVRDPNGQTSRFLYGEGGAPPHYLTSIIDPLGRAGVRNEYGEDGRLVAHIDAAGNRIEFDHDIPSRVSTVRNRNGSAATHFFDDRGLVTTILNAVGGRTDFEYDSNRNMVRTTVGVGTAKEHSMFFAYRGRDLVGTSETITIPVAGGGTAQAVVATSAEFDALGNPVSTVDPRGFRTRMKYSGTKLLETILEGAAGPADDSVSRFAYDSSGRLIQTTDPEGRVHRFEYTPQGYVSRSWLESAPIPPLPPSGVPVPTPGPEDAATSTEYDFMGRPIRRIDEHGNETIHEYDAGGRLVRSEELGDPDDPDDDIVRETAFDVMGNVASMVDPNGVEVRFEYDALNRLVRRFESSGAELRFEYDGEGNRTAVVDAIGRRTEFLFDPSGRLVERRHPDGAIERQEYDVLGNVVRTVDARGGETLFEFDELGRRISVRDALGGVSRTEYDLGSNPVAVVDPLLRRTTFTYDSFGRRIRTDHPDGTFETVAYGPASGEEDARPASSTDTGGRTTHFEYDSTGSLLRTRTPSGATWNYLHDSSGRLLSLRDPLGRVTAWTHDDQGRPKGRVLPLGQEERFAYDAAGNLLDHRKFDGAHVTREFDERGREVLRTLPPGVEVATTYDALGRRTEVEDARGATSYEYDARDRVESIHRPDGLELHYRRDLAGNVTRIEHGDGCLDYGYDALNRLATVTADEATTWTYAYDVASRLRELHAPNGTIHRYEYDARDRLTTQTLEAAGGAVLARFVHEYDIAGNRTRTVDLDGSTTAYAYDVEDRLRQETRTGADAYSRTYEYDAAGNMTRRVSDGVETVFEYDANDRLTTETTGGAVFVHAYDPNGNLVSRTGPGAAKEYRWDGEGRLLGVLEAGAAVSAYGYDGDGERISETRGGSTTLLLADRLNPTGFSQVLAEHVDGEATRKLVFGLGLLAQVRDPGDAGESVEHFLHDAQGSVRAAFDPAGLPTAECLYDAFGRVAAGAPLGGGGGGIGGGGGGGSGPSPYGFAGERLDPATGLYHMRARTYSPGMARFLSVDAILGDLAAPASLHPYAYGRGNPIAFRDPSGMQDLAQTTTTGLFQAKLADYGIDGVINIGKYTIALASGVSVGAATYNLATGLASDWAQTTVFPFVGKSIGRLQPVLQRVPRSTNSFWSRGWAWQGRIAEHFMLGRPRRMGDILLDASENIKGVDDFAEGWATQCRIFDLRNAHWDGSKLKQTVINKAKDLFDATENGIELGAKYGGYTVTKEQIQHRVLYLGIEPGVALQHQLDEIYAGIRHVRMQYQGRIDVIIQEVDGKIYDLWKN